MCANVSEFALPLAFEKNESQEFLNCHKTKIHFLYAVTTVQIFFSEPYALETICLSVCVR